MSNEHRRKRPKINRGRDDYMPGNIIEIELSNFMTFSHLKCEPGSRLNLVIGPNGAGKSSLVCAIALGLGGDPQVLGRATSVGAYVKRGEESGYIKICLRGDSREENITIMRKIDTRNKSEWVLNGKVVPKKDLIDVIQRFNIQVNNLTQFLPQDRVCEFAKLTPIQLLEETEKAVGDPRLPVLHRSLIAKSQEIKKFERAVESNKESLQQLKAVNAELERDVERVRQRDELLRQVKLMEEKLPWLKYDSIKAEYMEAKQREADARKKLDEAAKTLNELTTPIEKLKQDKTAHTATSKKLSGLLDVNMKKRMQILEDDNRLVAQIRRKCNEIEDLGRQEASHRQRISKAKEDLAAAELDLANLPSVEPPRDKIEGLAAQMCEHEAAIKLIKSEKAEKEKQANQRLQIQRQCVDRLKTIESTKSKRLYALQRSGADKIVEAYDWVQEHRQEFKREVYGPVLIEVNVMDQQNAAYLEGHIAHYVWKAFITQDPDDRDLLVHRLKPFNVPIINHVSSESSHGVPFKITQEMKMLGIKSRLDQVFDAPAAVREVLISQFGLDNSYIGSVEADKKADAVHRLGIMDLWTPENHYRWKMSRYGNHVCGSVDSVFQSQLIICNVDAHAIETLKSRKMELEDEITSLNNDIKAQQSKLRDAEDERAMLEKEREEILKVVQDQQRNRRRVEDLVSQRKSKLESIENEECPKIAMAEHNARVKEMRIQRFQLATKIKDLLTEAVVCRRSFAEKNMTTIELDAKIKEMETNAKHQEKFAVQASLHLENCKHEVKACHQRLESAKDYAESIANLNKERKMAFRQMPDTIEELENAIEDLRSQANSILFLNQNILEEYDNRERKIEALTKKQEADEKDLNTCLDEINSLKGDWLPTLRNIVAEINGTFSRNFQEMAVAGEVSLDEHDMDFDQYGILIKVKFRESGQLQVLSAYHQSGGERSVSTILYLVSLQDLTTCPFRVVDEINQGMDPVNERKMFQQLVRAASKPSTPQCFLLTPKLLPDLEHSEACSVLTMMNGPWIAQPSKVWSSGKSYGAVMGLV